MVAALLGVSTFTKPPPTSVSVDSDLVESLRNQLAGGQLQNLPTTQTRWYMADLETARKMADRGDLSKAAQLVAAMHADGTLAGLSRTLTSGLVRLPRRFYSDMTELKNELEKNNGTRSTFDEMMPPSELALLARDGHMLGIGVGEFLQVEGRDFPVFQRLEPEFLRFRWSENRWYYRSIVGELPITPGDGRWVLHIPGGRVNPWRSGLWFALGRAYIKKEHALLHQANYSAKLANPARVAKAPAGATETQRSGWIQKIIAWGINTVFELPPGWDVALLESNGRGWEVFSKEIEQADNEFMIAMAGQVVTTTGGTGFANADVHRLIRNDILQDVGDGLAHTLNTQGLPLLCWIRGGESAVKTGVAIEYQTKAPKDHKVEAETMNQLGQGLAQMTAALKPYKTKLEIKELMTRFAMPTEPMTPEEVALAVVAALPDVTDDAEPEEESNVQQIAA